MAGCYRSAMQEMQDFNSTSGGAKAVDDDVWCARNDEFARFRDAAGTAKVGMER